MLDYTERVLKHHARIQKDHREQTIQLMRVYVAGSGVFLTALGVFLGFLRKQQFPDFDRAWFRQTPTGTVLVEFSGLVIALIGAILLFRVVLRVAGLLPVFSQVLTSERISLDGPVTRVLASLPLYQPVSEEDLRTRTPFETGRGGVRAVTRERTIRGLVEYPEKHETRLLVDRLARIDRNEDVIDYNMAELTGVYRTLAVAVQEAFLGSGLVFLGLLGVLTGGQQVGNVSAKSSLLTPELNIGIINLLSMEADTSGIDGPPSGEAGDRWVSKSGTVRRLLLATLFVVLFWPLVSVFARAITLGYASTRLSIVGLIAVGAVAWALLAQWFAR
ncbi:MAG: hypothetical protein ABEI99_12825 [Halobaculum sp.]